jgi:MFS family permease
VGVAMFGGTVFLSQYFQLSLGKTPTQAGLLGLPLIFGLLVSSTVAGQMITKYGRWKAFLVSGGVVMVGGMLLLSTITSTTTVFMVSVHMFVLGVGVGLMMQNLVLAAQNDVPAKDLGATTSTLTFFRSLGGAIGVSALGAVLASKVSSLAAEKFGPMGGSGGSQVPDLAVLPPEIKAVIADIYATATAEIFLVGAPFAVLALLAVVFIKEKPLKEQSGDDRLAAEMAASH